MNRSKGKDSWCYSPLPLQKALQILENWLKEAAILIIIVVFISILPFICFLALSLPLSHSSSYLIASVSLVAVAVACKEGLGMFILESKRIESVGFGRESMKQS